ncbi:hypothetical protein SAMN05421538_11263 [Paracoccus isoporae]|uniref:Uncharacterized protein n=1 Tax=Paracoccus isoporae TaxID=591205 RepID=A0A1G7G5L6_9RHOB|nr:hypothetical protein [Paracoccus isoporae]SDE83444.1 hypothetical protein SAMN05421538_11263 [Paracoccus isoporae]
MAYEQQSVSIPNKIHGDRTVTAYCTGGLGTYRLHKRWHIVHIASGMNIGGGRGGDRRTRKGAFAVMDALLQVSIDWSRSYEEIGNDLQVNRTAIMMALATARNL